MEAHICPNCGAETTKNVCEYCGEKISIFGTLPQGNSITTKIDVKNILVAPFKIDHNGADKVRREYLRLELGNAAGSISMSDLTVKSFYIPVAFYTKFDELCRLQLCCSVEGLPLIFQKFGFPRCIYKLCSIRKSEYLSQKTDKDIELNRAETVMTPNNKVEYPDGTDNFVSYAFTAYLPFWVIEGKLNKGDLFAMYIFAGVPYDGVSQIRKVVCTVFSSDGEEISLKSIKAEYDKKQRQKTQEARTKKNKERAERRAAEEAAVKKNNRKFNFLFTIVVAVAIIGGFVIQSIIGGDIAGRIIIGLFGGLVTGLLAFFVMSFKFK